MHLARSVERSHTVLSVVCVRAFVYVMLILMSQRPPEGSLLADPHDQPAPVILDGASCETVNTLSAPVCRAVQNCGLAASCCQNTSAGLKESAIRAWRGPLVRSNFSKQESAVVADCLAALHCQLSVRTAILSCRSSTLPPSSNSFRTPTVSSTKRSCTVAADTSVLTAAVCRQGSELTSSEVQVTELERQAITHAIQVR